MEGEVSSPGKAQRKKVERIGPCTRSYNGLTTRTTRENEILISLASGR
jgi:hypothetical protein